MIKLDRLSLPNAPHINAIGRVTATVDAKRDGCEITYDPRTGVVSIFKGSKCSLLLPSGAIADMSDDQETDDAGASVGAGGPAPRRGRPPKNPPPVQT